MHTPFSCRFCYPPPESKTQRVRSFRLTNVVAWCFVPFDAQKRGPEARREMLERLGFKLFAYDYRAEHIPTFDAEMDALQRHHIRRGSSGRRIA